MHTFHNFFFVARLLLKSVHINFNKSDIKPHWFFYFAILNSLLCIAGETALVIHNFRKGVDFVKSIYIMWCCIAMTLAMIKTSDLLLRSAELKQFMGELEKLYPSIDDETKIKMHLKQINSFVIRYMIVFGALTLTYTIISYVKTDTVYKNGIYWRFDFIYPMLYPFDPYKHPIFEICHIAHQGAAYFTTFGIAAVDSLLYYLISYTCIHFYKFSAQFRRLEVSDKKTEKQIIVNLVEEHKEFIE